MDGVTIVNHPLVQHKLTLLRNKDISTKSFRELLKEIGMLLCYEITRDLPLADVEIETPLAHMKSPQIAGDLITEEHPDLLEQFSKRLGRNVLLPQQRQLVLHQRVVNDRDAVHVADP